MEWLGKSAHKWPPYLKSTFFFCGCPSSTSVLTISIINLKCSLLAAVLCGLVLILQNVWEDKRQFESSLTTQDLPKGVPISSLGLRYFTPREVSICMKFCGTEQVHTFSSESNFSHGTCAVWKHSHFLCGSENRHIQKCGIVHSLVKKLLQCWPTTVFWDQAVEVQADTWYCHTSHSAPPISCQGKSSYILILQRMNLIDGLGQVPLVLTRRTTFHLQVANLHSFPPDFTFPLNVSLKQRYFCLLSLPSIYESAVCASCL